mmetsp:Transcript_9395/g.12620  ORF Transcript_9395/g.12620 Transcript_9395/m.12620 type:complete len:248 (-) Transcript_9395:463-1206(-)
MTLEAGAIAPDFTLVDVDGNEHTLSQYRGKKVMLTFYRCSARRSICDSTFNRLKGKYKKLAWANKIDVIAVFQSHAKGNIRSSIKEENAMYPIVCLSDPGRRTCAEYGVYTNRRESLANGPVHQQTKSIKLQGKSKLLLPKQVYFKKVKTTISTKMRGREKKKYLKQHIPEDGSGMCGEESNKSVDYFINENGVIVDVSNKKQIYEKVSSYKIKAFLLGAQKKKKKATSQFHIYRFPSQKIKSMQTL